MRSCILKFSLSLALVFGLNQAVLSDAPGERFHVTYNEISKKVLKDAIGIMTITNGYKKQGRELKSYTRKGKEFKFRRSIDVLSETVPISNFGYYSEKGFEEISNFRYPVTDTSQGFLQIVYEPKENLRVWIKRIEVEAEFGVGILYLNNFGVPGLIDIFYLTPDSTRKIYTEADANSKFRIISRKDYSQDMIVIEQKGNFLKFAPLVNFAFDSMSLLEMAGEAIGWIKIKERGLLTIWIYHVDFC